MLRPIRFATGRILASMAVLILAVAALAAPSSASAAPLDQPPAVPSIWTDQLDYAPGSTVTLSGGGWQDGEAVHVVVNDDQGQTWRFTDDVTADGSGAFIDVFTLPDWFVATYSVTATGASSGVVTTSFTDGNLQFGLDTTGATPTNWSVAWAKFDAPNGTCSGTASSTGTITFVGKNPSGSGNLSMPNNSSAEPTGVTGVTPGFYFIAWRDRSGTVISPLCQTGASAAQMNALFGADAVAPTSSASSPTYSNGGSVTVSYTAADTGGADLATVELWAKAAGAGSFSKVATDSSPGATGSFTYTPAAGDGTYAFYTVATDTAANSEAAPASADSTTLRDTVAPAIADAGPTTSPNGSGWYKASVTNVFTASDGGSGLSTTCAAAFPANVSTGANEGTNVRVTSPSCTDKAGNTAAAISSAGFKIDKTAPVIIDQGPTTSANGNGWYKVDVTNAFKATDALSGLGTTCSTAFPTAGTQAKTTTGEGSSVTVTSDSCTDQAGNTATAVTSAGFKIDKTAPLISDQGPTTAANGNGWYKADVTNTFKATDALSGLDTTCAAAFATAGTQTKTTSGEGASVSVTSDACTDRAGNTATAVSSASFKIDKTAPAITDQGPTTSPNANGWYNHDVTNTFKATDGLSGLDTACSTAFTTAGTQTKTTSGEGTNVSTSSDSCTDKAGNTATAVTSAAFKVDETKPVITDQGPTTNPNANGWYKHDVTNTFKATDSLSDLNTACSTAFAAAGTQTKTTSGEGTHVSVISDACTDRAGNTAIAVSSAGFKIDKTAPTVGYTSQAPVANSNGWNKADVTATFTATDNLSGFDTLSTLTTTGTDSSTGEGDPITLKSPVFTDQAGNTTSLGDATHNVRVDKTAPTVAYTSQAPLANANGWNKADVTATFTATDNLSGFDTLSTLTTTGTDSSTGEGDPITLKSPVFTDQAGNTTSLGDATHNVRVDKTAPVITDQGPTTNPNANGWYDHDVTNTFKATDALSGLDTTCAAAFATASTQAKTTSGEGTNVTVTSDSCTDQAGNTATAVTSAGFKIDETAPVITDQGPTTDPNGNGWYNHDVTNTFKATDTLSGLTDSCATGYPANGAGDHVQTQTTSGEGTNVTVTSDSCTDKAGNTAAAIKSAKFEVDETAPSVAYTSQAPLANTNGWNNSNVTATFTATDNLSGFDTLSTLTTTGTDSSTGEGDPITLKSPVFTDQAGNTSGLGDATHKVRVDKTAPTVAYTSQAPVANSNGWNNSNVTATFTATDNLSGFDTLSTLTTTGTDSSTGEGDPITLKSPVFTDQAGNTSGLGDATHKVRVDKTAPTVAYTSQAPLANSNGWNNSNVTATFTATDNLSGFDTLSTLTTTGTDSSTGEGDPITLKSPVFTDHAGNTTSLGDATHNVRVDKTAPTVAYTSQAPLANANGWNKADVTATFTATDNLSGFDTLSTLTTTGTDSSTGEGDPITLKSPVFTDQAGNTTSLGDATHNVHVDKTAPVITDQGPTTDPNGNGWYDHDVTNTFKATDTLSGLDTTCAAAFATAGSETKTTSGEGTNVTVTSDSCTDQAGNTAAAIKSGGFKIDETNPIITDQGPTTDPNGNGWYNHDVTNTFKATDALSGLNGDCSTAFATTGTETKTTSGQGTNVSVTSDPCTDQAGNTATAVSSAGFQVDESRPVITDQGPTTDPNTNGWYNHDVTNTFEATDSLSGLDPACSTAFATAGTETKTTSGQGTNVSVTSDPCTDQAGNTATAVSSAAFEIDKVAPTVAYTSQSPAANSNGWNKADVTATFTATDNLSGFDTLSRLTTTGTDSSTGEGDPISLKSPVFTDQAGNTTSLGDATHNVRVDETLPAITGGATPAANANGWNNTTVTVSFTCNDTGSVPSGIDTDTVAGGTLANEGANQHLASTGSCVDKAGNAAAPATVTGINIDKTAPVITDGGPTPALPDGTNGWYTTDVSNAFSASDTLSGLTAACATAFPQSRTTSGEGAAVTVTSDSCTDRAGNAASGVKSAKFKIDETAPTVAYTSQAPLANANGWNNSNVTATFTATDNVSGFSGGATATGTDSSTAEGDPITLKSPVFTDQAGNSTTVGAAIHNIRVDTTNPVITDQGPTPALPNGTNGWYTTNVANAFSASDSLSGLSTACATAFPSGSQSKTTSGDGAAVTVSSSACADKAGNTASAVQSAAFRVDTTAPALNPTVAPNPVLLNGSATATAGGTDATSGVASQGCQQPVTSTVGSKTLTCSATDRAGNSTTSAPLAYSVLYGWSGFLQPINDTAHWVNLYESKFKLGSTVPVKFQISDAAGGLMQQAVDPTFSRGSNRGACDSTTTLETTSADTPTAGSTFRWDSTAQQYIYNFSTKGLTAGEYRINANLADGTTQFVFICLTK
jgi:large repetitive protein